MLYPTVILALWGGDLLQSCYLLTPAPFEKLKVGFSCSRNRSSRFAQDDGRSRLLIYYGEKNIWRRLWQGFDQVQVQDEDQDQYNTGAKTFAFRVIGDNVYDT